VDELDYLVSRGIKNLKICDELFTINPKHVSDICNLIIERKYDLNIWAYAKVGTTTPHLLDKMKEAGINWLCYGFEAGNEDVLDNVNKPQTVDAMRYAVEMTKQAGINIIGNFMFGLPGDTPDTMMQTLDLAKQLLCEWVNFYCVVAYPGSKLYDETPKELLPDKWEDYDQYSPNFKPLPTKYLTGEEVLEFRDGAFVEYFTNEKYLEMIKDKFGQQAVEQIKEMLKWKPRGRV